MNYLCVWSTLAVWVLHRKPVRLSPKQQMVLSWFMVPELDAMWNLKPKLICGLVAQDVWQKQRLLELKSIMGNTQ